MGKIIESTLLGMNGAALFATSIFLSPLFNYSQPPRDESKIVEQVSDNSKTFNPRWAYLGAMAGLSAMIYSLALASNYDERLTKLSHHLVQIERPRISPPINPKRNSGF
jgi:hypothetical protein